MQATRRALVLAAPWLLISSPSFAGAQREEDLGDSVRTALSAAVAQTEPPQMGFLREADKLAYLQWLNKMDARLQRKIPSPLARNDFLQTLWYEAKRAALEPSLVMGLVQVESNFRKYAVSRVGARGLMQVMPFWARLIGDGDVGKLFHLQTNLRFGCVILRYYLQRENGNLFMALGRYNGSRGRAAYPDAVQGAQRNWL